jgi:putative transposase
MNMPTFDAPSYSGYRFPAGIISHCTWLYFRFALSYRDVEEMMAERGVTVSYESVREWCLKFGGTYTKQIRSRRGRLGDRWHLDEVFLRINGKLHYLWRAVDQDGKVLDILVQSRRHKQAAKKFFRKLLKGSSVRSTDHRHQQTPQLRGSQGRGHAFHRSSSAERTQQPGGEFSPATRERERRMGGFKSAGQAQKFLSTYGVIASFFRPGRHLLTARDYQEIMRRRFT